MPSALAACLAACAALSSAALPGDRLADVPPAAAEADDECAAGEGGQGCALSALQRRRESLDANRTSHSHIKCKLCPDWDHFKRKELDHHELKRIREAMDAPSAECEWIEFPKKSNYFIHGTEKMTNGLRNPDKMKWLFLTRLPLVHDWGLSWGRSQVLYRIPHEAKAMLCNQRSGAVFHADRAGEYPILANCYEKCQLAVFPGPAHLEYVADHKSSGRATQEEINKWARSVIKEEE